MMGGENPNETRPAKPYSLRLTQSSKGVWYVDKLQCDGDTWEQVRTEMDTATKEVTDMVGKLNGTG